MFIRYQRVRASLIGASVIGFGFWLFGGGEEPSPEPPPPSSHQRMATEAAKLKKQRIALSTARKRLTPRKRLASRGQLLRIVSNPAKSKKVKDLLGPHAAWKVNVYDDDHDGHWDRVKIDRERDGQWDEKWRFKNGAWRDSSGALITAAVTADPETAPAEKGAPREKAALDPITRLATMILKEPAHSKKLKDAFAGDKVKVNLYDDDKDGRWDRAKVDRDRDNSWDEKWSRRGDSVERKELSSGKVRVWTGAGWKAKP